jgi:hypothetical protein
VFRVNTLRFTRRALPDWEVVGGRYFVTVRCADSLPVPALARLAEIQAALETREPKSPQFAQLQRRYFATMEKYLDVAHGACPLRVASASEAVVTELHALREWHVAVRTSQLCPIIGTRWSYHLKSAKRPWERS